MKPRKREYVYIVLLLLMAWLYIDREYWIEPAAVQTQRSIENDKVRVFAALAACANGGAFSIQDRIFDCKERKAKK